MGRLVVVITVTMSIAMALLVAPAAHAGLYMEHEAVMPNPADMTRSIRQTLHSWLEGQRFKRESPLRGETIIIDLVKREVYGVNADKKTYWKMAVEKYQQLALLSLVVMGVKVAPDGTPIVPEPMFEATGQSSTIEGRKAAEVRAAGVLPTGVSTSLWVSRDVPVEAGKLAQHMRISLGDPRGPSWDALFRQWESLPGYPVQNVTTIRAPQGNILTSETLLTFREMKIPDSEFQVPKGYALVTDPVTELERQAAAAQAPVGIGAPLGKRPPVPVGAVPKGTAPLPSSSPSVSPSAPPVRR